MTSVGPIPPSVHIALGDADQVNTARLQLLQQARHELDVYLPVLEEHVFALDDEYEQIRRLATSGRGARIRMLLHDTAGAARSSHRLLALTQRLPSVLQIHIPLEQSELAHRAAFMLNDSGGYLLLPDASRSQGRASLRDRASQAPLRQLFNQAWERSRRAIEWQQLDI